MGDLRQSDVNDIQQCHWSVSQTVEKEVKLLMWGQGRAEIVLSDTYELKKAEFYR